MFINNEMKVIKNKRSINTMEAFTFCLNTKNFQVEFANIVTKELLT